MWLGHLIAMFAPPENCGPSSLATTKRSLPAGSARLGHFEGVQCALELVFGQDLFFSRNLANRSSGLDALLGNFRRAIVTDLWREAGHHGHRKLHQFATAFLVCHDALYAFLSKDIHYVRQQSVGF